MRFKRVTFNPLSIMIGFHYGRNPVSGQRFLHIGVLPMVGLDFEFAPYVNDNRARLMKEALGEPMTPKQRQQEDLRRGAAIMRGTPEGDELQRRLEEI